jgi:hypothetical protein
MPVDVIPVDGLTVGIDTGVAVETMPASTNRHEDNGIANRQNETNKDL